MSQTQIELPADIERMPEGTPRQRALKLIAALDEMGGPNCVLNGALKVAIIAKANGLKKEHLNSLDHWIDRLKNDLAATMPLDVTKHKDTPPSHELNSIRTIFKRQSIDKRMTSRNNAKQAAKVCHHRDGSNHFNNPSERVTSWLVAILIARRSLWQLRYALAGVGNFQRER